eukprot:SAG22_NODE_67_length_22882_cov_25.671553_5_plen_253_part_00
MIKAWRAALKAPALWFGFVQLSTWCALPPQSLPQMRDAQMAALALPNVGYATNADHGLGCQIHPSAKQFCSRRLAHACLAQQYKQPAVLWKSPSYKAAGQLGSPAAAAAAGSVSVVVSLNDVSPGGLQAVHPHNYISPQYGANASGPFIPVDCTATFPAAYPNRTAYNASMAEQCAWASIQVAGHGWLNATVSVKAPDQVVLTAALPAEAVAGSGSMAAAATATSYGWGSIPMMSIYLKDADLPLLPWNKTL